MKLFIFLCIFNHLIITILSDSNCHESFQCGFLGSLRFPLSDSQPDCGFFLINCTSPSPSIQLQTGGRWFRITQKLSENHFHIRDEPLPLETPSTCNLLKDDRYLQPSSPFTSLTIAAPNPALFRCPYDSYSGQINPLIDDYFGALNYSRFDRCEGIRLYFRNSSDSSVDGEIAVPQPCVRMPFRISEYSSPNPPWFGFLDRYLTAEFDVQLNVSDACGECHQRGGQCGNNTRNEFLCGHEAGKWKLRKILLTGGVTLAALSSTLLIFFVFLRKRYKFVPQWPPTLRKAKAGQDDDIKLFFRNNTNLALKRYKYTHLKNMTKSFSDKLGQGGYGSVYKGKTSDGCPVAVKVLNESKENGKEFMNELASISRTSHINIVTLVGFCFDGAKRALVYEFMPNGSLEKYIANTTTASSAVVLGWNKLFEIAVGIARGLEYLHQGCNTRILHFDIKPHNILLDKDFNPKISDFGLAKLCPNRSSIVSMLVARGTIGYIAPELFTRNYEVSHKSDVYSYGMMILEMSGERKDIDRGNVDRTSEMYFPQYIYRQLEMDDKMEDSIDLKSESTKRKLIIVGLWCIQPDPRDRPSMTKVVEMLEGKLESLQVPSKHYIFSSSRTASQLSTCESMQHSVLI